ncbi:unnamed protein product [Blepharisma stoltei]|uniref:Uncharacterized protein n=1 Tax=Blepharisma stoltei TaxID=1481888 RepID=A0AAU9K5N8_9CILI|nr:unnamed protein product [Blepharisma stoltei]
MISMLNLYQKLMIFENIGNSLDYPNFSKIVDPFFLKRKTHNYLISFVDNQLKSQLYMSDFLEIYFKKLSTGAVGIEKQETVIKQMIIYTVTNNARESTNERELIIRDYIIYLMDYFAQNTFTLVENVKYYTWIEQIIDYIPSLYEFIIHLASEKLKIANDVDHRFLFAEIADITINKDMGNPKEILEIFQHIVAYLDSDREESDRDVLSSAVANYIDSQIEESNPFKIGHEQLNDATKIECWIRSVLIKKGVPNILAKTFSPNEANFIKQILQKLAASFPFQIIFNNNNILTEVNSYSAEMIKCVCEPVSSFDKDLFLSIVESTVAQAAFTEYGYDLTSAVGFEEKTFYVNLPLKTHSVTVLGGIILINVINKKKESFGECANIFAYLHELANILRKTENGLYLFENDTPDKDEGDPMAKRDDSSLKEEEKKEEIQIESILFGDFANKVNEEQVSFIINIKNWNMSLDEFKSNLKELSSCSSFFYQLCRDQYYSNDRAPHTNPLFWSK